MKPRRRHVGPYDDKHPDPAPDVYAVERHPDHFLVRHYPTGDAAKPCCVVKVAPTVAGESDSDVLARAAVLCGRWHMARATGSADLLIHQAFT